MNEKITPRETVGQWLVLLTTFAALIWGAGAVAYLIAGHLAALALVGGLVAIFLYGVMKTLSLALACGLVITLWGLIAIFFIRGFERSDDLGLLQILAGIVTAAFGGLPSTVVMCRGIYRAVHALPADGSPDTPPGGADSEKV